MPPVTRYLPLAILLALSVTVTACQSAPRLEVLGQAPDYQLVDQSGDPFGTEDLAGRAALVDFIYTHCTDACPLLTANLAQVQKQLRQQDLLGKKVMLVSVSVDPLHDTPPVLSAYADQYGADGSSWKFLTGDWNQVYETIAGFKVGVRALAPPANSPPPGGDEITHSTRLVLVDGRGQVRAYLHGDTDTPSDIVASVKRALD
jgi:protein SCO1/2